MKHLFTISLCFLALSLSAQETITYPYNPDGDADGLVAVPDIQDLLAVYGSPFSPAEIMVGDTALSEWIQILYQALEDQQEVIEAMQGAGGCPESIEYYGDTYNIVEMNGRCWFAENLRYLPNVSTPHEMSTDSALYYVYDYFGNQVDDAKQTLGYEAFGVYYNYIAIRDTQICPNGWSVPTFYQWLAMLNSIAVTYSVYNSTPDFYCPIDLLEEIDVWNQEPDYSNGGFIENGTKFSLKPSGFLYVGPQHGYLAQEGNSNMAIGDYGGWVNFSGAFIYLYANLQLDRAYCVRCIKD